MAAVIKEIRAESIAEEMEIESGDVLLTIDGHPINDMLDYQFYAQDDNIVIDIKKKNNEIWSLEIEKNYDEDLGFAFDNIVFDKMKSCKNRCIFCFVDQLPHHMRKTLYIKDDDYRYSFFYGNFVTLTNLNEDDWEKIIKMRLSPLYVSVHCMNGKLRSEILKNPQAGCIKQDLERLKNAGIKVHTQVVLCPGINDGDVLEETIEGLANLYPSVVSVGIVPIGLTGHRENLPELTNVTRNQAEEIICIAQNYQKRFRKQWGFGFVYLADEFYLRAEIDLPNSEYYDDYCQIENGIGLSRILIDEFEDLTDSLPSSVPHNEVYIVTGISAIPVLQGIVDRLNQIAGLSAKLIPVKNQFFGGGVTVTGLITGGDIIRTLGEAYKGKRVLIPEVVLREGQDVLLDDISLDTIKAKTQAVISTVDGTIRDLVDKILNL